MTRLTSRRSFLSASVAASVCVMGERMMSSAGAQNRSKEGKFPTAKDTFALLERGKRIPVVFDTDIGGDIDTDISRT